MKKYGLYLGRFNPIHARHVEMIELMLSKYEPKNCLLVVGSSSAPFSLRNFFSYEERRGFILKLFPDIRLVGLPDYSTDSEWLKALDDVTTASGLTPDDITYFGGCEEDIRFFLDKGRGYFLLDRFNSGGTVVPKLSATEVRDALIHDKSLEGMVDRRIVEDVKKLFKEKWERFKKI